MTSTAPTDLLCLATSALRDLREGHPAGDINAGPFGAGLGDLLSGLVTELRGRGIDDEGGWDCSATQGIPVSDVTAADGDKDWNHLAIATTALRDLHMGYDASDVVPLSGGAGGLDELLRELVTELRGRGVDDDGGWDCAATQDVPVALVRHNTATR